MLNNEHSCICPSDDKRAVTGTVVGSYCGDLLLLQVIYQGKTSRCKPEKGTYLSDWDITHSESHWSNEATKLSLFNNVLKQYTDEQRKKYCGKQTKALFTFDYPKSNLPGEVYDYMELENWCWIIVNLWIYR